MRWLGGLQSNFRVKPNIGCVELGLSWGFDNSTFCVLLTRTVTGV